MLIHEFAENYKAKKFMSTIGKSVSSIEDTLVGKSAMIKLKPRVSALEQTIINYESHISALETEIQNLKSI